MWCPIKILKRKNKQLCYSMNTQKSLFRIAELVSSHKNNSARSVLTGCTCNENNCKVIYVVLVILSFSCPAAVWEQILVKYVSDGWKSYRGLIIVSHGDYSTRTQSVTSNPKSFRNQQRHVMKMFALTDFFSSVCFVSSIE